MDYKNVEKKIELLKESISKIEGQCRDENRQPLEIEQDLLNALRSDLEYQQKLLPGHPLTQPGPINSTFGLRNTTSGPYGLVAPDAAKDWRSLFGSDGYNWSDKDTNFFSAVFSGRHHPGLIRASMTEGVPSSGGFLIPIEQAQRIHAVSLENELVMPRCYVQPMKSDICKIPAMVIGQHGTALFGGFTASYTAETGTISENDPKARSMTLTAKKLTGLIRFSAELNADIPGGMSQIENLCGKGLAWYRDQAFLKGTGAGQPMGILNSPCLVPVENQGGQSKNTILYENLLDMMSRMFAGSFRNSVWVASQSTIPQLLSLSLAIGLGGAPVPVMSQVNGQFTILTRPVIFTEKVPGLGSTGDIGLYDFSQYCVGLRSEMRFDTSIHVHFTTDELLSRIIERHDGQPLWDEALTLADGLTVSPFVVLEDRL